MVTVYSLTNKVNTPWGEPYSKFKWDNIWKMMLGMASKERKGLPPYNIKDPFHHLEQCKMNHLIYWFDQNVLQCIEYPGTFKGYNTTLVRLRIAQSMLDKIPTLSVETKNKIKEAFVSIYWQFYKDACTYYYRLIDPLPF